MRRPLGTGHAPGMIKSRWMALVVGVLLGTALSRVWPSVVGGGAKDTMWKQPGWCRTIEVPPASVLARVELRDTRKNPDQDGRGRSAESRYTMPKPPSLCDDDMGVIPTCKTLLADFERTFAEERLTIPPAEFYAELQRLEATTQMAEAEGYRDASGQRPQSLRWNWGHRMQLGKHSTDLRSYMQHKYAWDLAVFADIFGFPLERLPKLRVLDIGTYTGATALNLIAQGVKHVTAVEEVRTYGRTIEFIRDAYGIPASRLAVELRSLYDLDRPEFYGKFDVVLYPGVLYHVSDPLLSLRILFNALAPGGMMLVETFAEEHSLASIMVYEGGLGDGNNFYRPSGAALALLLEDAGFERSSIQVSRGPRTHAVARKPDRGRAPDIKMAGMSTLVC